MPPNAVADKRVVVSSPNRTEWLTHFGVSKGGGTMSAFYEYIDGGSASRFTPSICPGPGRTCCSNNFPYCGTPTAMDIPATFLPPTLVWRLSTRSADLPLSQTLAVHAWWTSPVWYNLIFGVSSMNVTGTTLLSLAFDRGGHQSSQGARSLDNWWIEGDLALLDSPGEWYHERASATLYYALNSTDVPPDEVILSALPSLVQIVGSQAEPVQDIELRDIILSRTASNFFAPFEALGGGDQAIERGGAVFAEGVEVRAASPAAVTAAAAV